MNLKQNPFSLYDFLGYFTPGALFIYGILAAIGHTKPDSTAIGYISEYLSFEKPEIYIPFVIAAYTVGHFLSFVSSITVERYSIWAHGYPSKYLLGLNRPEYFKIEEKKTLRTVIRTLVALLLAPITLLDWRLRGLYAKKLDDLLIAILKTKIQSLVVKHAGVAKPQKYGAVIEHDFFRYAYHYAVEHSPNHLTKMQNYVALYGFLRTITLIMLLLFWAIVVHVYIGFFAWQKASVLILSSWFVAYFFFMAFVKFYRRFSLEALMAMAVVKK